MNLGQAMLSIGALVLLSIISLAYFNSLGMSGVNIQDSKSSLMSTNIATSYLEMLKNYRFDEATSVLGFTPNNIPWLTRFDSLGIDDGEVYGDVSTYDDIDDFKGFVENVYIGKDTVETYRVFIDVNYVNTNLTSKAFLMPTGDRTFVKRVDVRVWRTKPLIDSTSILDTINMSMLHGLF